MTAAPEVLALIPARGGSKGIPRKNLIAVNGRPLIAYSIDQAKASRHIGRVIVSTDDEEIAEVAARHGAEVPFRRPAEFAQDLSPDIDAFRHALQWLERHEQYRPELVVHLRPTGPVRRVRLIDAAIGEILRHPDADSLRSVAWPAQTPYKMWRIAADGYLEPLVRLKDVAEPYSMPRQMLPEVFWQNGYVDVIRSRTILEQGSMAGRRVVPFVVNEPNYEIDYVDNVPVVEDALRRLEAGDDDAADDPAPRRYPV